MPVRFDEFTRELTASASIDDAWALMSRTIEAFGYVSIDYGVARLTPQTPGFEVIHHASTFNWGDRYVEREYARHDRITRTQVSRTTPFTYEEIWRLPYESERQREMEDEIREHGVRSGLAIPLHGPGPLLAAVDLGHPGPEEERARSDPEHRPVLVLIAALFNERMHRLLRLDGSHVPALAERERDCLAWAARGKTAWETAMILAISESAVKKHLASAAAKLDARTRTQAVAAALARGVIQA